MRQSINGGAYCQNFERIFMVMVF